MAGFVVTFPAERDTPDLTVEEAPAYSQEFADQIARHLGIREYFISLDTDCGWMTNRKTRASRHFTYAPKD